jgi:hypothetical protein
MKTIKTITAECRTIPNVFGPPFAERVLKRRGLKIMFVNRNMNGEKTRMMRINKKTQKIIRAKVIDQFISFLTFDND